MDYKKDIILKSIIILPLSFSLLVFELGLTRILSILFSYHYTFLSISLALLGLGLGGAVNNFIYDKINYNRLDLFLSFLITLYSISIIFVTIVLNFIHVIINLYIIVILIPFLISGVIYSFMYKFFSYNSNRLYFFDLIGASLGSLASFYLIESVGAVKAIFIVGLVSFLVALLNIVNIFSKKMKYFYLFILIIVAILFQYNILKIGIKIKIGNYPENELYNFLHNEYYGAEIIESRWSAYGRTDLVEYELYPDYKGIFIDGGSGSKMIRFSGDLKSLDSEAGYLKNETAFFPFYFAAKDRALIIGPGGGVDVLMALIAGMDEIVAVEVNPDIVGFVEDYSDYNGGLYTRFNHVQIIIEEGRSFLKRQKGKFDVILLKNAITKSPFSTSGYSLTENYLFTTNSLVDYLEHLDDNGFLAIITHHRLEAYKLISIALKAFENKNLNVVNGLNQMIVLEAMFPPTSPLLLIKNSPFTEDEIISMKYTSDELNFNILYVSHADLEGQDPILESLRESTDPYEELKSRLSDYNVKASTDDSPYFHNFERFLPSPLKSLLINSLLIIIPITFSYLFLMQTRKNKIMYNNFMTVYFILLGLGFISVETMLLQKFILFLGNPTFTVSILTFTFLLFCGIGSYFARFWKSTPLKSSLRAAFFTSLLLILYSVFLTPFLHSFFQFNFYIRTIISFLIIAPLGFFMGMPFPSGIKFLHEINSDNIHWMWCMNGLYSVLGSIISISISMNYGFNVTILMGASCYLGVSVISRILEK